MKNAFLILILFNTGLFSQNTENDAPISSNAPKDKPVDIRSNDELKKLDKLLEAPVKKARKTLPKAKKKYLAGMGKGEAFFLTTRIFDKDGKFEQIFVRIKSWNNAVITGTIADPLNVVKEYKQGQLIEFKESDVLDWTITKANGEEEGNFVGKFIDNHQ